MSNDQEKTNIDLTAEEEIALSNSVCGKPSAVKSLKSKGIVENVNVEERLDHKIAFYDLTEKGAKIHQERYVIEDEKSK